MEESFKIKAPITTDLNEVLVIPESNEELRRMEYVIILDGVKITTIFMNDDGNWQQLHGGLDEETIYQLGESIESHEN